MNNQKNLIVMVITLSLILIISSSYALLRSTKVSGNNYSISIGDLEVTFIDSQTEKLNLTNMYPMSDEEGESQEKALTFTVENTGTVGTYYDISIEELSTSPEFKSVIKYISNKDEDGYKEPKTLSENKYIELTGYLEPKQTSTYKVKVWLAEEADNTYMGKEFKAKIKINAYQESSYAKDVIKSKLVKYEESSKEGFTGGLVAVNTDGKLYNETDENQTIREYRYSGPTVKNYVTFNDETWRIIGVFKDENNEENVKIVRNELIKHADFPKTYIVNDKLFNIQYITNEDFAYWNSTKTGTNYSDWTTAGLMYWLNSKGTDSNDVGYLKKLSNNAQKMITEVNYYLGNLVYDTDTPITAYEHERASKICSENCSDGGVWSGNSAIWTGKIGLMYPSDMGYSIDSSNWTSNMYSWRDNELNSMWLKEGHNWQWFLSPSSSHPDYVIYWNFGGYVYPTGGSSYCGVRPTLYLKSDVKITSGDGSINNQYKLSIE